MGGANNRCFIMDMQNDRRGNSFCSSDIANDKTTLLTKGSILELCTNKPPPPKIISLQPLLEGLL
jgi:hypothetical protein